MFQENEVVSIRGSHKINLYGFESADENLHMIQWLRRGSEFRQFIVHDVERELYSQEKDAQLVSVRCLDQPKFVTKMIKNMPNEPHAIVSEFSAIFPLVVQVRSADGRLWILNVEHGYRASSMENEKEFTLCLDFTIVGHESV